MKDKRAAARKKKRRLERRQELQKTKEFEYNKFKQECIRHNKKIKCSKEVIHKIYSKERRKAFNKAVMSALYVTMYCLHEEGWGKDRLNRYWMGVDMIVGVLGDGERDVEQLENELILDAGVDIKSTVGDYEPFRGTHQTSTKKVEAGAVLEHIVPAMVIVLFDLYNQFGWKTKRMNRIAMKVKNVFIDSLENGRIKEITNKLEKYLGKSLAYEDM